MSTERLEEIKDEIKELMEEAMGIVQEESNGGIVFDRAKAYWNAHIIMALDEDHVYLGGCGHTFQDTIDELSGETREDEGG